jgi:hypothetical protein
MPRDYAKTLLRLLFISFLITVRIADHTRAASAYFIENKGQWDKEIRFRAAIPGGFLFLKEHSLLYVLYEGSKVAAMHAKGHTPSAAAAAAGKTCWACVRTGWRYLS